jgi:FAD/FMN-containing dehydrogenase
MITEATLRLLPKPAAEADPAGLLPVDPWTPAQGVAASRARASVPGDAGADGRFTIARRRRAHSTLGLDRTPAAMLMIESDAGGAAAEARAGCRHPRMRRPPAPLSVVVARRPAGGRLAARGTAQGALVALEQAGVARMEDVGVPRSQVPELLDRHRAHLRRARAEGRRLRARRRRQPAIRPS